MQDCPQLSQAATFFLQIHDPTTPMRQGNNRGASYRSVIYYTDEAQRVEVLNTIADVDASGLWLGKVVTEVEQARDFWQAEPEHQDYLECIPNGYTRHFLRPNWVLPRRAAVEESLAECNVFRCQPTGAGTYPPSDLIGDRYGRSDGFANGWMAANGPPNPMCRLRLKTGNPAVPSVLSGVALRNPRMRAASRAARPGRHRQG